MTNNLFSVSCVRSLLIHKGWQMALFFTQCGLQVNFN